MRIHSAFTRYPLPARAVGDAQALSEPNVLSQSRDIAWLLRGEPAIIVDRDYLTQWEFCRIPSGSLPVLPCCEFLGSAPRGCFEAELPGFGKIKPDEL